MSKTWYPVIDYVKCTECGTCTNMCRHGVYDTNKIPTPVVVKPENCIHGCYGCGNRCPVEAIAYVGDNKQGNANCGCSCDDGTGGCC